MKKTKFLYLSLALGSAALALVSCGGGSKSGGGNKETEVQNQSDLGVKMSLDQKHYSYNAADETNGTITFYNMEFDKDTKTKEYLKDTNGNYFYKSVSLGKVTMAGGQAIDYLPTPKRDGYTFVGWYVDEGLGTEFYYKTMPNSANLVAYARWQIESDVLYVSPKGSPFNTGKKASQALTLNEAARVYKAGATIIMEEGTYSPRDTVTLGNDGNKDAITKIEGNGAVLDFQQTEDDKNYGIKLTGDYTNISDLTIQNAGDNGIMVGSSNNIIKNCVFTKCHDTGCQISRYSDGVQPYIDTWPSNNLILNCTSFNNCDTQGEDADGFAAKLTVGQGNIFDGCLAYWNVDDGWDLYAKADSGRIGTVTIRNSASFANGHHLLGSAVDNQFSGDGNGFKLGGSSVPGEVIVDNCVAAYNNAHGFTDNSNPGTISISNCTSINNGQYGDKAYDNFNLNRDALQKNKNYYSNLLSYYSSASKNSFADKTDELNGSIANSVVYKENKAYLSEGPVSAQLSGNSTSYTTSKNVSEYTYASGALDATNPESLISTLGINWHKKLRNADGSLNLKTYWAKNDSKLGKAAPAGAVLNKTSDTYAHDTIITDKAATDDAEYVRNQTNALNLAVNSDYIYNDVYLPTKMGNATVTWTSSNANVIKISEKEEVIPNTFNYTYGVIPGRIDTDTEVTLTATISYNGVTATKAFKLTVQGLDPRLGDISGIDNVTVLNNETLPALDTYKVHDYVSSAIELEAGKDYTVKTEIGYSDSFYATPSTGIYSTVSALDANKCGTYKITYTFKITGYPEKVVTRYITIVDHEETYEVCGASTQLGYIIDNTVDLNVNTNYGDGTIYAIASSTSYTAEELATMKDAIKNGTIDTAVSALKTQTITSRDSQVSIPLNDSYVEETSVYVYLLVSNANGDGAIYKTVEILPTELISTAEQLKDATQNADNNRKAYKLVADIDCQNVQWNQTDKTSVFKGYFDGNGHTIKNLVVEVLGTDGGGLFFKVDDQAIIKNLMLNEVFVRENEQEAKEKDSFGKVGIITGEIKGGATIENIYILNCGVKAYQRVGGIAGQLSGSSDLTEPSLTTIRNVVIETTKNDIAYSISAQYTGVDSNGNATYRGGKYVGGIIAHCQYSGAGVGTELLVENCYVKMPIYTVNQYSGGIVGRIDPKQATSSLTINNCIFAGVLNSNSSYTAGILGGRSSGPRVNISNCVVTGIINGSSSGMTVSQQLCNKQTAGTEKWYTINEDYVKISNCYYQLTDFIEGGDYASEAEYLEKVTKNKEYYGKTVFYSQTTEKSWWEALGYDFTNVFTFEYNISSGVIIRLNYFQK